MNEKTHIPEEACPVCITRASVSELDLRRLAWDLAVPFPVARLSWRPGSTNKRKAEAAGRKADKCIPLAYINARDVEWRLDKVVGEFNWRTASSDPHVCSLTIILPDGREITRTNRAGDTDIVMEKGAYSTAFKRAASSFGIGRYLYELPNKWTNYRSNYDYDLPELPTWASPEGYESARPRP